MRTDYLALPALLSSLLAVGHAAALDEDTGGGASLVQQVTSSEPAIDLVGTWFTQVKTKADIRAPIVGVAPSDIDLALKLYVTRVDGRLSADVSLCNLATNSANLVLGFDRVEKFIKLTESITDFVPTIGGKVPLPNVLFRIGQDAAGTPVDLEKDGNPGATIGAVALGLVPIDAYAGLNLDIKLDAKLDDAQTVSGTATFSGDGKVFGSNFPLLTSGFITVTQTQLPTTFTAKHFAGDVPCETLLPPPVTPATPAAPATRTTP